MSIRNTGGHAFPAYDNTSESVRGMTLRDYFAAKAMLAISGSPEFAMRYDPDQVAERAYEWADAMLKARQS